MTQRAVTVLLTAITGPYVANMGRAATATAGVGTAAAGAQTKTGALSGAMGGLSTKLLSGGGVLFALNQGADLLMSYEDALVGVSKTTGLTGEELSRLGDDLSRLAVGIEGSAEDMLGIAQSAAQLGVANEDILEFTEVVAGIASATDLTADQAATDMARLVNIMQLPMSEMEHLGDVIVALGNNMATTEPEILNMAQRIASAGDLAGLSAEQVMALAAAASSVGLEAEAGGTAISQMIRTIEESTQKGGERLETFATIAGQSSQEFAQAWTENPQLAFQTFIEGLADVRARGGNVAEIFDTLGLDGIRVSDTMLRLSGNTELLAGSFGIAEDAAGALADEVETANQRLSVAVEGLTDKLKMQARTFLGNEQGAQVLAEGVRAATDSVDLLVEAWTRIQMPLRFVQSATDWMLEFGQAVGVIEEPTTAAEIAQRDLAQSMVDWGGQAARYMATSEDVEAGLGDLETQMHDTRQAQRDLADEMLAATDPAFAYIDAQGRAAEAADAYSEAVDEHGASSDEANDALLELLDAQGRVDAAALDAGASFAELTARVDDMEDQGRLTADQADVLRQRIRDAREEAQDFAGNYRVNLDIQVRGMQAATDRLTALATRRYGATVTARAHGGPVDANSPYVVGEEGPELFWPDTAGRVIPAGETARMSSARPVGTSGGGDTYITVHAPNYLGTEQDLLSATKRVLAQDARRGGTLVASVARQ